MALLDILGAVFNKIQEYAPEMEKQMMKAQERLDKKQAEVDKYKNQYSGYSNQELRDRASQGVSGTERAALNSIAQERRQEYEECRILYSDMNYGELSLEYTKIRREKGEGSMNAASADMRLSLITRIMNSRGYYLNSDLGIFSR